MWHDEKLRSMTKPTWRELAAHAGFVFVFLAAFPRLGHRLRWPTRLGPRGLLGYIAFNTAFGFALRTWALPYMRRVAEERQRAEERLREQLGREPTEDEVLAHLVARTR